MKPKRTPNNDRNTNRELEQSLFTCPKAKSLSLFCSFTSRTVTMPPPVATISFTAPRFSEEELAMERRSLSQAELAEIDADVLGTRPVLRETEQLVRRGLSELNAAIRALDPCKTMVYKEALKRCPDLVATETDPLIFLRSESFDAKVCEHARDSYRWWYPLCLTD